MRNGGILVHNVDLYNTELLPASPLFILDGT